MTNRIVLITQPRSGSTLLTNSIQSMLNNDLDGMNKATEWFLVSQITNQATGLIETTTPSNPLKVTVKRDKGITRSLESRFMDFYDHCEDFNEIMSNDEFIRGFQEWHFRHGWIFRLFKSSLCSNDWRYWRYLETDNSLKIIHLNRANVLDNVVSLRIAHEKNVWHSFIEQKEIFRVNIDLKYLNDMLLKQEFCTWYVTENIKNALTIEYNQLVFEYHKVMNNIKDFCGLVNDYKYPGFVKTNPFPKNETIINYKEVVNFLKGTKNEWMLYN